MARRSRKPSRKDEGGGEISREEELFFQEVNEELKQERAAEMWKKYGAYVIGGAVAIVLAVGGWQYWRSERQASLEQANRAFHVASARARSDDIAQATEDFVALANEGSGGYAALAHLRAAALLARSDDIDGALQHYGAVAENDGFEPGLRRFATLMWALHGLDRLDPQNVLPRLRPLTDENDPWRHSARELAALYEDRAGNRDEAVRLMRELAADGDTPTSIRLRAREMVEVMGGATGSRE